MRKTMKVCLSVLLFCSLVLAGCGMDGGQTDASTSSEGISSENAADASEDTTDNKTTQSETQTDGKENARDEKVQLRNVKRKFQKK